MRRRLTGLGVLLLVAFVIPVRPGRVAAVRQQRILFIGDSITANPSLLARQTFPERVARKLGWNVLAQVIAAPGASMAFNGFLPGFASLTYLLAVMSDTDKPAAIVILLGTNDAGAGGNGGTTVDSFRSAYTSFLASAPGGVPIVCITPPWNEYEPTPNASGGDTLEEFRAVIRDVCASDTIVEGVDVIPHDPAYFLSPLHPNARGTKLLAEAVAAALKPFKIGTR